MSATSDVPSLRLDASRDEALGHAAAIVGGCVAELRPGAPRRAPDRRPPAGAAPGRAPRRGVERPGGPRRRGERSRRVDRAAPAAVLRVRRLVGARDRRHGRPARVVLRRQPRGLVGCRVGGRGPGRALGRRVRRVPGRGRGVHERRDDLERHGPRSRPRARASGLAPRRRPRAPGGRLLLERGALLGGSRRRAARARLRERAHASARRSAPASSRRRGGGDRRRPRGRCRARLRWSRPPGRR